MLRAFVYAATTIIFPMYLLYHYQRFPNITKSHIWLDETLSQENERLKLQLRSKNTEIKILNERIYKCNKTLKNLEKTHIREKKNILYLYMYDIYYLSTLSKHSE